MVTSRAGFAAALEAGSVDLVLAAYPLPGWTGRDALALLGSRGVAPPFILIADAQHADAAGACLREGASDYVLSTQLAGLAPAVIRALGERALRESEQRYRSLLEAAFDGVVITDGDLIVEASQGFAELFGVGTAELVGTRFDALLDPSSEGEPEPRTNGGGGAYYPLTARARDGRRLDLEAVSRSSLQGGRRVQLLALRNRTAHHEQERQRLRAQRLEAVGQLAGGIAHDFNNILTSVLGYSQFLIDQLPETDPLRADAQEIYRAGELAVVMTRKLLAFSRRQPAHPEVLDLNHAIGECVPVLARLLGEDIRIELETQARPAYVTADPSQLEQVLLNLAANARDAMPQGGRLGIRTASLALEQDHPSADGTIPAGRYVRLSVVDEGIGMPPDVRARIFEPFYTTKGGAGTGLGLSTVSGILQQAGARIVVESHPGRGAAFHLYFPTADAASASSSVQRPLGAALGDETVLVVEDQPAIRALTRRVLTRAGYGVLLAENGDEARRLAREAPRLHLIVMDVLLPGERGPRLAGELREQHPDARLLFISGNHGVDDEAFLPQGPRWFLQKPFTPDQFLASVRTALDASVDSIARETSRS